MSHLVYCLADSLCTKSSYEAWSLLVYECRRKEDFGRFSLDGVKATMSFLGASESQPELHNPDYDFPDSLIPVGAELLLETINQILG